MATSQFTIYTSEDVGAPVLNGLTGSLLNVLNNCLVTGYGSKPGAGWTKPFPDTSSLGWFKTMVPGLSASFFALNDSGSNNPGREALLWGLETASVWTNGRPTGSGLFPSISQAQFGVVIRKSALNSNVSRTWIALADSSSVYFMCMAGDNLNLWAAMFGEFFSLSSNDAYRSIVIGRSTDGTPVQTADMLDQTSTIAAVLPAHFVARSYTGIAGSMQVGKHGNEVLSTNFTGDLTPGINIPDSGVYISPVWIHEATGSAIRGKLPGLYQILHPITSYTHGQMFTGTGNYAGKTFMVVKQTANNGLFLFETSNTIQRN